jgi:ribA/ribD-fused uncharacterized protein
LVEHDLFGKPVATFPDHALSRGCRRHGYPLLLSVGNAPRVFQLRAGIDLDGSWWPTVENYYQAQKFTDPDLRQSIRRAERPTIAKTLADENKAAIRPDWDAVKDKVMYRAVRRKFELHPALKAMLLATGGEDIAEANPADSYWGVGGDGTGLNKLGKIMTRIRDELPAAAN